MTRVLGVIGELKTPKNQYNSFGKYKYRSLEDILEEVKPLLKKYELALFISDDIVQVGDRHYIKATASIYDMEGKLLIKNSAFAREPLTKKGMDEAQITGATSSYARKYALNGLFLIDDTKDQDTDEYQRQTTTTKQPAKKQPSEKDLKLEFNQMVKEYSLGEIDGKIFIEANGWANDKLIKNIKYALDNKDKFKEAVENTVRGILNERA